MRTKAHLSRVAAKDEYYQWILDLVCANPSENSYFILFKMLHSTEFKWFIPNDDNRAFEGRNLREQFCDELGIEFQDEYFNDECTMLELVIGLAYRCENIMADSPDDHPMKYWFWHLLSNVGLDTCTDEYYCRGWDDYIFDRTMDRIINRTYKRSGEGGFFPLKFDKKDQRKVELWYQMSVYLVENYYKDDALL
jgi:hypothetical protein